MDTLPICLQEHVISYLRANDASSAGAVCKEWRQCQLDMLNRAKWDSIMKSSSSSDKVSLDCLVVAVGHPELREKAKRYVLGKTKFAYKGVTIALNRAKDPDNIYIVADHGKLEIRWTNKVSNHTNNFVALWGCSVRCRRASAQSFVDPKDIRDGFHFLSKLKPLPPDATESMQKLVKYLQKFRENESINLRLKPEDEHDPYEWYWATKHKNYGRRVSWSTMLDCYA